MPILLPQLFGRDHFQQKGCLVSCNIITFNRIPVFDANSVDPETDATLRRSGTTLFSIVIFYGMGEGNSEQ